jgi:hypothetical protein
VNLGVPCVAFFLSPKNFMYGMEMDECKWVGGDAIKERSYGVRGREMEMEREME